MRMYFQEYDPGQLDLADHGDLIIQRTLEFGDWEDLRWLFAMYGVKRIRAFLRQRGERWLRPPVFNYWRILNQKMGTISFPDPKGELWPY